MEFTNFKNDNPAVKKSNFAYHLKCPICESQNIKDKYKLKDYIISECLDCSAVFVKEILTDNFLTNFYQKSEGDFVYEDNNQQFLSYYYHKIKSEIEKIKPAKGAILDIGCSAGFFLNIMEGWERYGMEIAEKFGQMAREKIGDNIYIGSFENYPIKENYFDVITLQDVFDHFIDPVENLKKCYQMLKPGGLLVIKAHNISCLYAKIKGVNFYAIIPPVHLFYFNEQSLKYLFNRVGLRFLKSKFIGHILQLKTIFYRLSGEGTNKFYFKLSKLFEHNILGKIRFYKNLHDIITVFAIKEEKKEEVSTF